MTIERIPLSGGMYQARSVIASAQRCVNLYPEKNSEDAPFPYTYQLTPGATLLIDSPVDSTGTAHRCCYTATNGQFYEVIGDSVFATSNSWERDLIGTITGGSTPVYMSDNGLAAIIVDGSADGWCIDLSNNNFASISGQGGAFLGGTRVDYIDTFFLLNNPGTNQWYISLSNVTFDNLTGTISPGTTAAAFDPLDIAAKTGNADPIQAVIAMHREAWLIGTQTTEVWYDAGSPDFAFAPIPGVFIEHGTIAPYSVCKQDLSVYWLSEDKQGNRIVFAGNQYAAHRISTHAIEQQLSAYTFVADVIGFTYQQLGHTFYVLVFPSANATWVFDIGEELWHERNWINTDGIERRIRANDCASAYGIIVFGDYETGELYQFDLNNYFDVSAQPIVRRRSWPDIQIQNRRAEHSRLVLDIDVGEIADIYSQYNPSVSLRYSDNRGKTWGTPRTYNIGSTGQYDRSVVFTQLGQSRNRVYELFWFIPAFTALNGGDVWVEPSET